MLKLFAALLLSTLSGCVVLGDATQPIETLLVPSRMQAAERTLIVVLPGFGIDAESVRDERIPEALHAHWPEADIMLTSATFDYYKQGTLPVRLREDVIEPARKQGYREIWLAGGSMGGTGVLFYEMAHPGEMTGLIMLAPWLGSSDVRDEVQQAGGIAKWDPGAAPVRMDADNFDRELWRLAKKWSLDPEQAGRVWLACGSDDWLIDGNRLLSPALPSGHFIELPGSHDWDTFRSAAGALVKRIRERPTDVGRAQQ